MPQNGADLNRIKFNYETGAEFLGISERTLHKLVEDRKISCVKIGTQVRFRQVDMDQYVSGCVRPLRPDNQLMLRTLN